MKGKESRLTVFSFFDTCCTNFSIPLISAKYSSSACDIDECPVFLLIATNLESIVSTRVFIWAWLAETFLILSSMASFSGSLLSIECDCERNSSIWAINVCLWISVLFGICQNFPSSLTLIRNCSPAGYIDRSFVGPSRNRSGASRELSRQLWKQEKGQAQ